MEEVLVSINCITYNHEKYIGQAIESFLSQETNFNYEIIIGDDCSTDNTKKIVEEYVEKYPNKIRLITDVKNVGARNNEIRIHNASRGKYIAICEGDDYWIDNKKLQKQIDYMEKNQECTLCFHNAKKFDDVAQEYCGLMIDSKFKSMEIGEEKFLELQFIPTASTVYRKEAKENFPNWYMNAIVGDLPSHLILIDRGYAYYIDEIMSAYRVNNINSVMNQWKLKHNSIEKKVEHFKKYIYIFDEFNKYTNYKYDELMKREIFRQEFLMYSIQGNYKKVKEPKYKEFWNELSNKSKLKVILTCISPTLYEKLIEWKVNKFKNKES